MSKKDKKKADKVRDPDMIACFIALCEDATHDHKGHK